MAFPKTRQEKVAWLCDALFREECKGHRSDLDDQLREVLEVSGCSTFVELADMVAETLCSPHGVEVALWIEGHPVDFCPKADPKAAKQVAQALDFLNALEVANG